MKNNATNIAIDITGLNHFYGKQQALSDIQLRIPKGTTVGLVGPDGVGKSTLLSLIAGVKVLQQGRINVFGLDIANVQSRDELAHKIAFMPQGLGKNLYPTLSIFENIDFHARLYGLPAKARKQRIQRLLNATGLSPFTDRPAGKLSGGMKQKLSLCCALVHNPDLLILDEPTTGVDPLSRRQFWELVESLRQEEQGMTVIVATAYIDEAERFEHLLAMTDGKLIANEPTRQVMADTQSKSLEEAYIKLLPKEKRGAENGLVVPPFHADENEIPAMEAEGLTKRFGDFVAVDHVSFRIPKGEIFGFLGSNGCGKSTTMKMLTGLLDATEGSAKLLGKSLDANNMDTRKQVGYMSQAFSLYEELTVQQNLLLHAKLYQIDKSQWDHYVQNVVEQFDLSNVLDKTPASLPLGIRQRLQLAAACLHKPQVLILDEPTSGVDPAARDMFWQYLIKLSREDKITIFVSTHFMNEAARCDRISFMHRGRVLAVGTPDELQSSKKAETLEEAFILYLEEEADDITSPQQAVNSEQKSAKNEPLSSTKSLFSLSLLHWFALVWTFAIREGKELLRDKIRLMFAIGGPAVMLLAMGSSISFDINPTKFTVLDDDRSSESQALIEYFTGSPYFIAEPALQSRDEINTVLQRGNVKLVIEIPNNFGQKLLRNEQPEIGLFIDGAFPFTAESLASSASGVLSQYVQEHIRKIDQSATTDIIIPRFMYNQDMKSIFAMTPGIIMLAMMMVPAMMTALGIVREKESGSIMNLYGSPASKLQFLLGKQLPYITLAFMSYLLLIWIAVVVFSVPIKGSAFAMLFGGLLAVIASTGFGLVVSCFVKSQIAALFASAIMMMVPTLNFSGMMYPASTLPTPTYILAHAFPSVWFQLISLGGFTKGLGFNDFLQNYLALIVIYMVYLLLATHSLKKQEE
ncbi:ribosome-dependent ATPase [Pasteurella langaaensis DSM 22999]|uniref:Ribosome-dependent ATPase n=1 Tax=Alitibacter langaaensis DSM 22999 TaxID=1122935 RepID=A0A2U0TA88_9PAST|nr:ribosome-associated ATPase/putative transporter RbbA [Pasteurella langaaensis]PVX40467.1 ribosome-dependent ATPase [Pasteurella langaaensis DSM 22999]